MPWPSRLPPKQVANACWQPASCRRGQIWSQDHLAALPLPRLEQLAEDLLDFSSLSDLLAWFAENESN